jgi:hypothetical protein
MTKQQRERLAQVRERISTTRGERAKARQAMAAAEQLREPTQLGWRSPSSTRPTRTWST